MNVNVTYLFDINFVGLYEIETSIIADVTCTRY